MAFEALMISLILNLAQHMNSIVFTNRSRISIPGNSLSYVHRCDTGKMESFQCHLSSRFSNTLHRAPTAVPIQRISRELELFFFFPLIKWFTWFNLCALILFFREITKLYVLAVMRSNCFSTGSSCLSFILYFSRTFSIRLPWLSTKVLYSTTKNISRSLA